MTTPKPIRGPSIFDLADFEIREGIRARFFWTPSVIDRLAALGDADLAQKVSAWDQREADRRKWFEVATVDNL